MQVTGMLHGGRMLQFVGFPTAEVLGPDASEEEIKALIDRHGSVFVKPVFKGGVGKKGKAGLLSRVKDLKTALKEKERLYFVEHHHGNQFAKANGVTFEGAVPAEHEVYFSLTDSTHFRAPTMTLTHHGGMDIEEVEKSQVAQVPFDPLTGFKAFVVRRNPSSSLWALKVAAPALRRFDDIEGNERLILYDEDRAAREFRFPHWPSPTPNRTPERAPTYLLSRKTTAALTADASRAADEPPQLGERSVLG
jgi:ATP-grasp domain